VHRPAKPRPRPHRIPHRSSPSGRPWPPLCFKCFRRFRLMFQASRKKRPMFQAFYLNVAKVNLRFCIRCNNNIHMLQAYIFECFSCFQSMFQLFHHDVAEIYLDVT
jgi:hypothetical protein